MTTSADLLSPIWTSQLGIAAYGGIYRRSLQWPSLRHELHEVLISLKITDSVHAAARQVDVTFSNFDAGLLAPVHTGSVMEVWGYTLNPTTGATEHGLLFIGTVYVDTRADSEGTATRSYRVYDALTMLARNEGTGVFDNNTLTEIVTYLAALRGIPVSVTLDTGHRVGRIIQGPGMSDFDVIAEAAERTYRESGIRYIVRSSVDSRSLELVEMGQTGVVWQVRDGSSGTLLNANFEESAEDLATEIRAVVMDSEDPERVAYEATATWADPVETGSTRPDFARSFGTMTKVVKPDNIYGLDGETVIPEMIQEYADTELARTARTVTTLTTSNLMIPGVRRGDAVNINLERGGVANQRFYVENVVSTYTADELEQTLDLSWPV